MVRMVRLQRNSCAISLVALVSTQACDDRERRNHHLLADHAHRFADRVILGQVMHELREAADLLERFAPHRNGLPKARARHPEREPRHDAGQKLVVGRLRRQARPEARIGLAAIDAGDEPHAGLLQFADHIAQIARARRSRRCRQTPAHHAAPRAAC